MSARAALDARVLEWMREPLWGIDDERFGELALALFEHQFEHCPPYQRFCAARGRTPQTLGSWQQIPAVPAGAFKEVKLRGFPEERTVHTFRTSGTSTAARGELQLDTLELYEASLLPTFCRFLLPDLSPERPEARILVLAPSPAEVRDSSLSHMFGVAIREVGSQGSGFFVEQGELQIEALLAALDATSADEPLLLCGTAFAFVHLLDADVKLTLPPKTRIMETGGFKGRSRVMPRTQLYLAIEDQLGVPVERIVNQYGMTELGSQFYDSVLLEPELPRRKLPPPWARVRIVPPDQANDAEQECEQGSIVVYDLANTGSVLAIRSADLGRRLGDGSGGHGGGSSGIGGGFEVLGREPGAEERGCSIAADELLG